MIIQFIITFEKSYIIWDTVKEKNYWNILINDLLIRNQIRNSPFYWLQVALFQAESKANVMDNFKFGHFLWTFPFSARSRQLLLKEFIMANVIGDSKDFVNFEIEHKLCFKFMIFFPFRNRNFSIQQSKFINLK